jgi:hypothetical protein
MGASVETVQSGEGLPRLRLRGDGVVVVPGDSGGGVWLRDRLLGNLWSNGVEIQRSELDRLLGRSRQTETGLIFAALLPYHAQTGGTAPVSLP